MGKGGPRAHLGRNPDRLNDFRARGTFARCGFDLPFDTPRALRDMGHRNRYQLFGARIQRTGNTALLKA